VWYVLSCLLCAEFCVAQICRTRWKKILLEPFWVKKGQRQQGSWSLQLKNKKKRNNKRKLWLRRRCCLTRRISELRQCWSGSTPGELWWWLEMAHSWRVRVLMM
jgi:hypothetical protein